jgi:hypothetical protein
VYFQGGLLAKGGNEASYVVFVSGAALGVADSTLASTLGMHVYVLCTCVCVCVCVCVCGVDALRGGERDDSTPHALYYKAYGVGGDGLEKKIITTNIKNKFCRAYGVGGDRLGLRLVSFRPGLFFSLGLICSLIGLFFATL